MSSGIGSGEIQNGDLQSQNNIESNVSRTAQSPGKSSQSSGRQEQDTRAEKAREEQEALRKSQSEDQEQNVKSLVETLNEVVGFLNRDVAFNVLPDQEGFQAEVRNSKTDEIIKKIPRDDTIKLKKKMDVFVGMMIDEMR